MTSVDREKEWRRHADELQASSDKDLLVRIVGAGIGQYRLEDAAAAELQRRMAERLTESVDRFSDESTRHSWMMFGLTLVIAVLTVALLLQGFGCLPATRSPTSQDGNGERADDVEGGWDEHR